MFESGERVRDWSSAERDSTGENAGIAGDPLQSTLTLFGRKASRDASSMPQSQRGRGRRGVSADRE